jgi:hypothetical protein
VGLGLIGSALSNHVSTHPYTKSLHHITHLIAQSSLVASKDTAVLAEASTWGIVALLTIEGILASELLESLLAVLLGLFGCVGAGGREVLA